MELATFERLIGREGQALLAEVSERAGVESDLALGTRLRQHHDADLVAAAVTQHHLRGRAAAKFGADSARVFLTHDALEQATRARVARGRAARLAGQGVTAVLDLGCGIGADLIAFARAGLRVRGVEIDPVRAGMAQANLTALGLPGEVRCADAGTVERADDEIVFHDPARRDGRGRIADPERMVPPWSLIAPSLSAGRTVVKTRPGIPHHLVPPGVEAQWISDSGDLVEACLWSPDLATAARRATVLPRATPVDRPATDAPVELTGDPHPGETGPPGAWLAEPDDAVIRAGLVGAFAATVNGRLIDPHLAYVTSDAPAGPTPLATWFRIVEELPSREKALGPALAARDIGPLTVKKRGVDVDPDRLVRRLRLRGHRPATVVLARVGSGAKAWLVERATPS